MRFFKNFGSDHPSLIQNRDDVIQFLAGAALGVVFVYWAIWTFQLIVLG